MHAEYIDEDMVLSSFMTRVFIITCQMMQCTSIAHAQFVKLTVCMILPLSIIQKIVKTKPFVQSVT